MILVRHVFQVKFGHMDAVLELMKQVAESDSGSDVTYRMLTDISGNMFTLVTESRATSVDVYLERMQALFEDPEAAEMTGAMMEHMESGYREFFTVEFEA